MKNFTKSSWKILPLIIELLAEVFFPKSSWNFLFPKLCNEKFIILKSQRVNLKGFNQTCFPRFEQMNKFAVTAGNVEEVVKSNIASMIGGTQILVLHVKFRLAKWSIHKSNQNKNSPRYPTLQIQVRFKVTSYDVHIY